MRRFLVVLALVLSACAQPEAQTSGADATAGAGPTLTSPTPSWEGARAAGVDFRGIGQEPGWLLDIYTQEHIVLDWDYGERRAIFALPAPIYPVEGTTRYEANTNEHALTVTVRRSPCQDTMSGEAFPASVEIVIDGRALTGCGRSV